VNVITALFDVVYLLQLFAKLLT